MQHYQHKSVDELRLEDYKCGNKGPGSGDNGVSSVCVTGNPLFAPRLVSMLYIFYFSHDATLVFFM